MHPLAGSWFSSEAVLCPQQPSMQQPSTSDGGCWVTCSFALRLNYYSVEKTSPNQVVVASHEAHVLINNKTYWQGLLDEPCFRGQERREHLNTLQDDQSGNGMHEDREGVGVLQLPISPLTQIGWHMISVEICVGGGSTDSSTHRDGVEAHSFAACGGAIWRAEVHVEVVDAITAEARRRDVGTWYFCAFLVLRSLSFALSCAPFVP